MSVFLFSRAAASRSEKAALRWEPQCSSRCVKCSVECQINGFHEHLRTETRDEKVGTLSPMFSLHVGGFGSDCWEEKSRMMRSERVKERHLMSVVCAVCCPHRAHWGFTSQPRISQPCTRPSYFLEQLPVLSVQTWHLKVYCLMTI